LDTRGSALPHSRLLDAHRKFCRVPCLALQRLAPRAPAIGVVANFECADNLAGADHGDTVAPSPQKCHPAVKFVDRRSHPSAFAEADRDLGHLEAFGRDADRLLAVRHADVHRRREIGALDRQHEAGTGVAAADLAGGRIGLLLPAAGHLSTLDLELGQRVDGIIGTGAAHTLAHLSATVGALVGDGAFDAFRAAVAQGHRTRARPVTGQVFDRRRADGQAPGGQAQEEGYRPKCGVHCDPIPAPRPVMTERRPSLRGARSDKYATKYHAELRHGGKRNSPHTARGSRPVTAKSIFAAHSPGIAAKIVRARTLQGSLAVSPTAGASMANRQSTGPRPRPTPRLAPDLSPCHTNALAPAIAGWRPPPRANSAAIAADSTQPVPWVCGVSRRGRSKRTSSLPSKKRSTAAPVPCPPLRSTGHRAS